MCSTELDLGTQSDSGGGRRPVGYTGLYYGQARSHGGGGGEGGG